MSTKNENAKLIQDIYTLTPLQEGLLYHHMLQPTSTHYITQRTYTIMSEMVEENLIKALELLSLKHDALRTAIRYKKIKDPRQVVFKERKPEFERIDLSKETLVNQEAHVNQLIIEDLKRGFDLQKDTLLRVKYIKLNQNHCKLLWTSHHIIVDGWSSLIIMENFHHFYEALNAGSDYDALRDSLIDQSGNEYKHYVKWLEKQNMDEAHRYWDHLLDGYDSDADVKALRKYEPSPDESAIESLNLGLEITEKIQRISIESNVTTSTIIETIWGILLQQINHTNDVVFGKVVSGRDAAIANIEQMVGLFINMIPQRVSVNKKTTFKELIVSVQNQNNESNNYDYCSIANIQSRTPQKEGLIKTTYVFQNFMTRNHDHRNRDNPSAGKIDFAREQSSYPLSVKAYHGLDGIVIELMYLTNKFSKKDVKELLDKILNITKVVVDDPEQIVSLIPLATEAERKRILETFNDRVTLYPSEKTVIQLFEEQVEKTPERIAVVFKEEQLTYQELNMRANALAHKLRALGVAPNDYVAIIAERSIEMIIGIYGVIKSGGAYVPLDPTNPLDRINYIIEDCRPKVVLMSHSRDEINLKEKGEISIPVIDLGEAEVWEGVCENPIRVNQAEDLIYCIYTSGTTGKPKGVMIEHRSIVNLIKGYIHLIYNNSRIQKVLLIAPYVFDMSIKNIFGAILYGATLHIADENMRLNILDMYDYINENNIDLIDCTPQHLKMLSQIEFTKIALNAVLVGGEKLEVNLVRRFENDFEIYNGYGPTECSVNVTWHHCSRQDERDIPIGRPIPNTRIYIMDNGRLCGIGVPGELCVTGIGLARGYLNRPELTKEFFVDNPYEPLQSTLSSSSARIHLEGKLYRTGDLARWLPDGTIEYIGRIDEQVKIRGFRIELREIESAIRELEAIKDCVVIVKENASKEKAIYSYLISDQEISLSWVRDQLVRLLPDYMIPAYMKQIDVIPITKNGKLNKRALPEIEARTEKEYVPPRTEVEEKICIIFEDILDVHQVGIKDSFFELGGHSLRATRLVNRIEAETGVRIILKEMFLNPTVEALAELVDRAEGIPYTAIPKAEEKEYYEMSSTQRRIYLITEMDSEAVTYNMPRYFQLTGEVDPEKIGRIFQKLIDRHEILRTAFMIIDGKPVQRVQKRVEVDFEYVNEIQESKEKMMSDFVQPFDLGKASQLRAKLINMGSSHLLMLDMHHIISDGMSMAIVINEFTEAYNGKELKPLTHQFKDYSEWMRKRDLSHQREYWMRKFSDEIPVLDLPLDYARPKERSYTGATFKIEISKVLRGKIKELAKRTGSTDYMVFLSSIMVLLGAYANQEDVVIGSPISGRTHKDTESLLGMFVNTLAMRGRPEKEKTFERLLEEVKQSSLKAYENQEYPFEELVENVNIRRDFSRNPLFDVMLVLHNNERSAGNMNDVLSEYSGIANPVAKFDLTFHIGEMEGSYNIVLDYSTALFQEETVARMLEHYVELLWNLLERPTAKLKEVSMIGASCQHKILEEFNDHDVDFPRDKTIVTLLEEQVAKTPKSLAVVFQDQEITYQELNLRANALAHQLRALGVGADDYVGIMAKRSIEMVIGIFGIIKAGGAYVPIDPTYPRERIEYMLADSRPKVILTYQAEIATWIPVIDLGEVAAWEGGAENLPHVNTPSDLAYLIYTSGTTGKPKGVMIEHKNVVRLIKNDSFQFDFNKDDVWSLFHSSAFDFSVWELFGATLTGGKLVIIPLTVAQDPQLFLEYIEKYQISILNQVPSAFYNLMRMEDERERMRSVRYLIFGGEALNPQKLLSWYRKYPNAKIVNMYGITETTVHVTYKEISDMEIERGVSNIGRALSTLQTYILNNEILCGIGVPGELCVAGEGLARGYLNQPDLTAAKFVDHPFGAGRLYRSGDLARWLSDGSIEYLGRIDDQVKIRGFRIELGEIESTIRGLEVVKDCAVIVRDDGDGEKAIYAYLIADAEIKMSDLRDNLVKLLPAHMIPAYMTQIESLPITSNGKLDKSSLPEIEVRTETEYIPPRTKVEEKLCGIFESILGVEQVGIKDNFFELGGHSLRATRLLNQIEAETGVRMALKAVFGNPTVEALAKLVTDAEATEYIPIPKAEAKKYYEMSSAQKRIFLLGQINPEAVTYNMPRYLKLTGAVRVEKIESALQELVNRHEILRTAFMMIDGEPMQWIWERVDVDFEYVGVAGQDEEQVMLEFMKPFDLERASQLRAKLINMDNYHLLMFDMHHIISDGMSMTTLINEFTELYNGKELEPTTHQFKDYSEWMRSRDLSNQRDYWIQEFSNEIPVLDLPLDYARPKEQSFAGAVATIETGPKLGNKIKTKALQTAATEYMVFLASAMVLLGKYANQEDVVIGSPISGRTHKDTEQMLGMFVGTLAMRGRPEKEKSFASLLEEVKWSSLKAYENQEYPFEELVEAVDVRRDLSRNPLFDVMLVLQNNEGAADRMNDVLSTYTGVASLVAKFDLTFNIREHDGNYLIALEYSSALFKQETAQRMLKHYVELLQNLLERPAAKLKEVTMITEFERRKIFEEFGGQPVDYPRDKTVIELFEEQVAKTPDQIAAIFCGDKITYKELNQRANALAHQLRDLGVRADDYVAIIAERSSLMIVGIYGIIKAGGAYIPLDPTYPMERIKFMLEDSQPKVILTYQAEIETTVPIIDLRGEVVGETENPVHINKAEDLLYCIYTSGTTGKPKGVMVTHRNVINLVKWYSKCGEYSESTVVLQTLNYIFDASVEDIFPALLSGCTLEIVEETSQKDPEKLLSLLQNKHFATTPSMFNILINYAVEHRLTKALHSFKKLYLGGESISSEMIKKYQMMLGNKVEDIFNLYGPTEATVTATYCQLNQSYDKGFIGRPINNVQVYIMQDETLCGIGVPGQLCIGGAGVARGYLNQPELTKELFVNNPYGEGRLYLTGDLARWLPDGNIEYLGRIDEQVKIRGFRIELSEIESAIRKIADVVDAAVIIREERNGEKSLSAYFIARSELNVGTIQGELRKELPEYMIPLYMMQIEKMPVTATGKLDRRALPNIELDLSEEYVAPTNPIQHQIIRAYAQVLNLDSSLISVRHNFFQLGGNSIDLLRAITILKKDFELSIKDFYSGLSISELSDLITHQTQEKMLPSKVAQEFSAKELASRESLPIEYQETVAKLRSTTLKVDADRRKILITGVTGFLGGHLLMEMLRTTDHLIYAIVRGTHDEDALSRVMKIYQFYFNEDPPRQYSERIVVYKGDISEPCLGLNHHDFLRLSQTVDVIINTASNVKHYGKYEDSYRVNVLGVKNLIEFQQLGISKTLIHCSTISLASGHLEGVGYFPYTEETLSLPIHYESVYLKSKAEAERLLFESRDLGLKNTIIRLGNLQSNTQTGKFQINDLDNAFISRIKGLLKLGVAPDIDYQVDYTPVDQAATACVKLIATSIHANNIYHIYNPYSVNMKDLLDSFALESSLEFISIEQFNQVIADLVQEAEVEEEILKFSLHSGVFEDVRSQTQFKVYSEKSNLVLKKLDFTWEKIEKDFLVKVARELL